MKFLNFDYENIEERPSRIKATLDDTTYTFTLKRFRSDDIYYLDVQDERGEYLVAGIALNADQDIFESTRYKEGVYGLIFPTTAPDNQVHLDLRKGMLGKEYVMVWTTKNEILSYQHYYNLI